ncbi:hypothetical protein H0H81_012380 [Sphagnurus paluster]|uniref:Non-ribosomal peptide synthetase n=1 Tax=Sphagnurus paluster TaxID=117069 RepID=A0A9P7KK95_9AGAR|nr:hypothetical protein H0H81_012380 [Sphagnurus paluster]
MYIQPSANTTVVSVPVEKKIDPSSLESQTSIWAGYEQDVLPPKEPIRLLRNIRYQIFYIYRRLFGLVFFANFGLVIWVALNFKNVDSSHIGLITIGNLFGAILMRQDYVVDAFFVVFTSVPRAWPLWIRRLSARVYHLGGLHSGGGVSGAMWLIFFCVKATLELVRGKGVTTPGAGSFVRLSDTPMTEWHSFATMPEPGKEGFSVVISRAGDWTIKMIANPPTHIWKRGVPTYGVMKILPMFRRVVLVATGSGIAPCTPAILEAKVPIRVLWTAPDVRQTFGDKLVDSILKANPESVIYNTRQHGKPDMVKLTYRMVTEFKAEAVIIISNQTLTEKVVYGMMSRGIPAFGAIWDS